MKNAFFVLGATPEDSSEKLKELFEEKQLFCDDDKDLEFAYLELINVKKRIKHEIGYFTSKTFKNFDKIFFDDTSDEQEIVIADMCKAIIKVGKWFDLGIDDLFVKINNSREIAKFTQISDKDSLQDSISELRSEYILAIKKYFDYFKEKDIVLIFNNLVKEPNYMSFFVDDLLSIYESALQVSIENKEKTCLRKFKLVENGTNYFLDFDQIPSDFSDNINDFKKSLVIWDSYVQPLQVNSKNRGVQHEGSIKFASLLRNKVIDMCNESQESLQKLIKNPWGYGSLAKQILVNKIVKSIEFTNYLIKILNILQSTFAEMVVFNERLQKDKEDFENLKEVLETVLTQIDPYKIYREVTNEKKDSQQVLETTSNTQNNNSLNNSNDRIGIISTRWRIGIIILLSIIETMVNFSSDDGSMTLGIISLGILVITCIYAFTWKLENIKLNFIKIFSILLVLVMIIVCIASVSISSTKFEGSLTTSNFKRAFKISHSVSSSSSAIDYIINEKYDYSSNYNSSDKIEVIIRYRFLGGTSNGKTGTQNVILEKKFMYYASGKIWFSGYFSYSSCSVDVSYVKGSVYL